jgi:hypothetical protein
MTIWFELLSIGLACPLRWALIGILNLPNTFLV